MGEILEFKTPSSWKDRRVQTGREGGRELDLLDYAKPLFMALASLEHLMGSLRAADRRVSGWCSDNTGAWSWRSQARQLLLFLSVFICLGASASWADLPTDTDGVREHISLVSNRAIDASGDRVDAAAAEKLAADVRQNIATASKMLKAGMTVAAERAMTVTGAEREEIVRWMRSTAHDIAVAEKMSARLGEAVRPDTITH